jgi:hypothetical protein
MNRRTFLKTSAALTAASTWITREATAAEAATPALARAPRSAFSKRLRGVGRILELDGWNVWCCSPIFGPDGKVHVFYARWPGTHDNWLTHSEIAHAVADRPEGPYTDLGTILKGRGGDHWDADTSHNPTIHRIGNRYALFYIGNNLADAKRRGVHHSGSQRIGLALADSIDGPWQRVNGDGLILDGPQPATLDTRYARHRFQGDHPVHARLIGGPVTDLNVMTRRETWQHTVVIGGGWLSASLLVALEPSVVRSAGGTVTLAAGDAAFPEADAEVRGVVAAITFTAVPKRPRVHGPWRGQPRRRASRATRIGSP